MGPILVAAVLFGLVLTPLVAARVRLIPLVTDESLLVWADAVLWRLRWLVGLVGLLLVSCSAWAWWRGRGIVATLAPLGLVAALPVLLMGQGWLPQTVVSNTLFLLPVLCASLALSGLIEPWLARSLADRWPWSVWPTLIAFLLFTALGLHMTRTIGEHSGDEGHYLIQARSLWHDGDLDIRNNLREEGALQRRRGEAPESYHCSPFSRGEHWYSWHLPGLSFLLAPTVNAGLIARHAVLGGLAALACLGMIRLCRRTGASLASSLVVVALFSASLFWSVYAARALPEVFGAALLVWLVWAIAACGQRPRLAIAVAACCSVGLLWTQSRFDPLALLGAAWFALRLLLAKEPLARRCARLAAFALLAGGGAAHFLMVQFQLFEGGLPLKSSDYLFNYWPGLHLGLLSERGLFYSLPLAAWMIPAHLRWIVRDRENRFVAIAILTLFTANAVLATSNNIFTAGACLPGRYYLCVTPLLLPACAHLFRETDRLARTWFIFLALLSSGVLVLMLATLEVLRKAFIRPLGSVEKVWPLFRGLLHPFATERSFFEDERAFIAGIAFGAVLLAGTALLLWPRRRPPWLGAMALATIVGTAAYAHAGNVNWTFRNADTPQSAARELAALRIDRAVFPRPLGRTPGSLFEVVNLIDVRDVDWHRHIYVDAVPEIPPDRGDDGDHQWSVLADVPSGASGERLLHVAGQITGVGKPILALRQGSKTLVEKDVPLQNDGRFELSERFTVRRGAGALLILLRLEGPAGSCVLSQLNLSPWSDALHEAVCADR